MDFFTVTLLLTILKSGRSRTFETVPLFLNFIPCWLSLEASGQRPIFLEADAQVEELEFWRR